MRRKFHFVFMVFIILPLLLNVRGTNFRSHHETLQIVLKSETLQTYLVMDGNAVEVVCPFSPYIWYHNEQYFQTNRTLNIKAFSADLAGLYSCQPQIQVPPNKIWANVTLNVCSMENSCLLICNDSVNVKETKDKSSKEEDLNLRDPNILKVLEREMSPPFVRECSVYNRSVFEDDKVKFECYVVSDLESYIVWFKHDYPLNFTGEECDNHYNPNAKKLFTHEDEPGVLQLGNVQSEDQGWYTCLAINSYGVIVSTSFLSVLKGNKWSTTPLYNATTNDSDVHKCSLCYSHSCIELSTSVTVSDRLRTLPIINDKFPRNQTVLTNSSSYLECRVVSDLEPYIVWLKYTQKNATIEKLEKMVPNFITVHSDLSKDVVILEADPDKPYILNFTKVQHDDEGWYTCVAASELGQTVASAYMRVVDKRPPRNGLQRTKTVLLAHIPPREGLQQEHPVWITIVIVILCLLGILFIVFVWHRRNKRHQRKQTVRQWTKKVVIYKPSSSESDYCALQMPVIRIEKQRTTFRASSNSDPANSFNEYEFPLDANWEIPRSQLSLGSLLGEGAFGRVVMARCSSIPRVSSNGNAITIVAVKMVKEDHTDADMASLVHEMEVMKMIGQHINIINLLGCCSQNGPLWVIVEFAVHGNLKDFLKKNRPVFSWASSSVKINSDYLQEQTHVTENHLSSFAVQIARGMEYLATRRCIHRDLAARNVLVSDAFVMKIADFGLARDIQDTDYYRQKTNGLLPIKWMAPESLLEKFYDSQSDVWSYGVLLWEIMTYGEQPYPNIISAEELLSFLKTGQRLEMPPRCSIQIYTLMCLCWHIEANLRPTFIEIVGKLDNILQLSGTSSNQEYSNSDEESEGETF